MDNQERPFSREFVIRKTQEHMLKSIDISLRKTFERLPEFENTDPDKAREIFDTIQELLHLRMTMDTLDINKDK